MRDLGPLPRKNALRSTTAQGANPWTTQNPSVGFAVISLSYIGISDHELHSFKRKRVLKNSN